MLCIAYQLRMKNIDKDIISDTFDYMKLDVDVNLSNNVAQLQF